MKKLIILITTLLIATVAFSTATYASTNSKADVAYKKEVKKIAKTVKSTWYKFTDITGDGVHEAIIFGKENYGSGNIWKIYTYKNSKAKLIFDGGEYGLDKIGVYKKTNSLYYHRAGHGFESYVYMQLKNGKYEVVCAKSRSQNGGSWSYNNNQSSISKSTYNNLVKKLAKGKEKKLYPLKWEKHY